MNRHLRHIISKFLLGALTGLVTPYLSPNALGATPDDSWEAMSAQLPGVDGRIDAFATLGSRLYAGGRFRVIGGLVTSGIASWDGTRWSAVGSGINGGVGALLVRGSDLIAAGDFTSAGGVAATNVARWDGLKWNALGSLSLQPVGNVLALAEFKGEIYAGGNFQITSEAAADYIAVWNGSAWLPVGGGVDGVVYALHNFSDALYAGGAFTNAGGAVVNGIARWDGSKWESIAQGVRGGFNAVYALSSVKTNLYVGGDFTEVGGDPSWITARGLARLFNDSAKKPNWRSLNVGQVSVRALRGFEDRLLVGGRFTRIGTATSPNVAELSKDGDWISFGAGVSSGNLSDIAAIEPFGSDVFCGGFFETAGDQRIPGVARWTGSAWLSAGGGTDLGLNQGSWRVKVVRDRVYVLGSFNRAGPTRVRGAAEWTGTGWLPMGAGVPQWTQFLQPNAAADGRDLYVSMNVGLNPRIFVHRWDGAAWIPVGEAGPEGPVAVSGTDIFAVGTFAQGYGVAKLEGAQWTGLGGAFTPTVTYSLNALAVSGANVYAGGTFTAIGGEPIAGMARWDGAKWQTLGTGFPGGAAVWSLAVSGDRLYAGGVLNSIYVWNGSAWSTLPGFFTRTRGAPRIYSIVPDGSDLWVGGSFERIDDLTVNNIARWDGTRWHALGSGIGGTSVLVYDLDVSADKVYVAGPFTTAGGKGSRYFAIWHKPDSPIEIVVNSTGDQSDADPADDVPDVDLTENGLQTTLRCAIEFANRRAGKDIIKFEIKPEGNVFEDGVPLIRPKTSLTEITDPVVIDGWSQNPSSETPPIHLNGFDNESGPKDCADGTIETPYYYGWPCYPRGLVVASEGCEIRGLCISQFQFGIALVGGNNVVQGCFLGTDPSGTRAMANSGSSFKPTKASPQSFRGCNLLILSGANLIGGQARRLGNLISGQGGYVPGIEGRPPVSYYTASPSGIGPGIVIDSPLAVGNVIQGNIIGLDRSGARQMIGRGPPIEGVETGDEPARQSSGIRVFRGTGNLIGGSEPGSANVISDNVTGIVLEGDSVQANRIEGNLIGADISGTRAFGNTSIGIAVAATGNFIGGSRKGAANVITANNLGIGVYGARNIVEGNIIGLVSSGGKDLGNAGGIDLIGATENSIIANRIGYSANGIRINSGITRNSVNNLIAGNLIYSNVFNGIAVYGGQGNRFTTNSFVQNGNRTRPGAAKEALGIDLYGPAGFFDRTASPGVSANDDGDFDGGPNTLQNYPDLFPVRLDEGIIRGRLSTSLGSRTYRVEVFASAVASPTGHGEGERFLGAVDVNIGIAGENSFTVPMTEFIANGTFITATATDPDGNTSEFSKAVQACSGPDKDFDGICDDLEGGVPGRPALAPLFFAGSARASRALLGASPNHPAPGSTDDPGEARVLPQNAAAAGDGNGDGVPDSQQANVASVLGIAGQWLTLAAANGLTLKNVEPSGPPDFDSLPSGYSFPLGFVSFTLAGVAPGGTATVTNIVHDAVELTTVFAYGPTPGNAQPHWYELSPAFAGDELRLTFTDGANGDHDLAANGAITTIYAPAYRIPPGPTLTLLSYKTSLEESLDLIEVNGIPTLTTNQVPVVTSVLAWPAAATNYLLQSTDGLSPTNFWQPIFTPPTVASALNLVTNTSANTARFYRLRSY